MVSRLQPLLLLAWIRHGCRKYQLRKQPLCCPECEQCSCSVVDAFTYSHLDYCNSLLFGISDCTTRCSAPYWYSTYKAHHAGLEATSLAVLVYKSLTGLSEPARAIVRQVLQLPAYHYRQQSAAAEDFNRPTLPRAMFQEPAQVWAIDHSLLLDRISGTAYLSAYVIMNLPSWSPQVSEDVHAMLKTAAPGICCFRVPYKCTCTYFTLQYRLLDQGWYFLLKNVHILTSPCNTTYQPDTFGQSLVTFPVSNFTPCNVVLPVAAFTATVNNRGSKCGTCRQHKIAVV